MRCQFQLSQADEDYLNSLGLAWETVDSGNGGRWVIVHEHPILPGYNVAKADAAVMLPTGYPDVQIDMVYFYPALQRADNGVIRKLRAYPFDGRTWQQWSRHRTKANPWRAGVDDLSTHFLLVRYWLERELPGGGHARQA